MYFVVLPDGQKFGPADLNLLNQWAMEGRVLASTMLEDARTGQRMPASSVAGIQVAVAQPPNPFPAPGTMNPPEQYGQYYRPGQGSAIGGDTGSNDLTLSYVFGALGIAMCAIGGSGCSLIGIVFPILGLVYAKKAQDKGNPSASGARTLSIVAIVLQIISIVIGGLFLGLGILGGFG